MGKFLLFMVLLVTPLYAKEAPKAKAKAKAKGEISQLQKQKRVLILEKKQLLKSLSTLENSIQDLLKLSEERREQITQHQRAVTKQLPILTRLGRSNPWRLLIDPRTSQDTIRGITLVRALAKSLKNKIAKAQAELNEIKAMKQNLQGKAENHISLLQNIDMKQSKLEDAKVLKIKDWAQAEEARLKGEDDVNILLEESRATGSRQERATQKAAKEKGLPFQRLEQPVAGKIMKDPKLQKKFSPQSQGVVFQTKKNADVLAPSQGTVVFKGPFLSQGEILILDHGKHVHTVFMGMHKISAEVGQNVYAGEKLGKMAGYGANAPLLYFELRYKGQAIDPMPFMIK
jgi:septal ring factor EnvC (AmiA/AmiB activator)